LTSSSEQPQIARRWGSHIRAAEEDSARFGGARQVARFETVSGNVNLTQEKVGPRPEVEQAQYRC
jgi:hypothetical protein